MPVEGRRVSAKRNIAMGAQYPYGGVAPTDWAEAAALGILYDLNDRRGIKNGFDDVDMEVRMEIVTHMADIIRTARTWQDESS